MEHIYSEEEIEYIIVKTNHFINEHTLNYNKAIKRIICKSTIRKETIDNFRNLKNCTFNEYIALISKLDKKHEYIELISVHDDFHKLISELLSRYLMSKPISETLFNNLYFSHVTLLNLLYEIIEKFDSTKNQMDKLTDTWNRNIFIKFIDREYLEMKRGKESFCLAYFGIDQFENINEEYNHDVGDFILKDLIKLIKNCLREYDSMSRWAGAEFIILLPDASLTESIEIINKIKDIINQKNFIYESNQINLTCSFGISIATLEKNVEEIINEASRLLYLAKSKGKDMIEVSSTKVGEISPT